MTDFNETLSQIRDLILERHEKEFKADPKGFRLSLLGGLRKRFPLPKGRRRSHELDQAEVLRASGYGWNDICLKVNPDYQNWDSYRRQCFRQRIQNGLRLRKVKRKRLGHSKQTGL